MQQQLLELLGLVEQHIVVEVDHSKGPAQPKKLNCKFCYNSNKEMIRHILVEGSHNKEHHLLADVAQSREMYDFYLLYKRMSPKNVYLE